MVSFLSLENFDSFPYRALILFLTHIPFVTFHSWQSCQSFPDRAVIPFLTEQSFFSWQSCHSFLGTPGTPVLLPPPPPHLRKVPFLQTNPTMWQTNMKAAIDPSGWGGGFLPQRVFCGRGGRGGVWVSLAPPYTTSNERGEGGRWRGEVLHLLAAAQVSSLHC
jgi:hypothetical protein